MLYLFDTDAVSEVLRPKPLPAFLEWLRSVQREDQFISAVTVGELYHGAYRSAARERHLANIEERVLPAVTILPYDGSVARVFGQLRADLERAGTRLDDADLQIASTALHHGLELVTGNVRHFQRVPGLHVNTALVDARR
ncbi:type II toxin-antitoxin system VapC family toxin [soil metagenome]